MPKGTRGKDLNIVIQKKKLSVGLKGQEPIMSGELCKDIKIDESTWTLGTSHIPVLLDSTHLATEDQQLILVHLEKQNKQQWWENVLTHHPKIDTKKIVPENSKLSDLDGETRYVQLPRNLAIKSDVATAVWLRK